jgi:hypothetical protein
MHRSKKDSIAIVPLIVFGVGLMAIPDAKALTYITYCDMTGKPVAADIGEACVAARTCYVCQEWPAGEKEPPLAPPPTASPFPSTLPVAPASPLPVPPKPAATVPVAPPPATAKPTVAANNCVSNFQWAYGVPNGAFANLAAMSVNAGQSCPVEFTMEKPSTVTGWTSVGSQAPKLGDIVPAAGYVGLVYKARNVKGEDDFAITLIGYDARKCQCNTSVTFTFWTEVK